MSHYHAVVWLDHAEARILSFNPRDVDETRILSHPPHRQVHHKAGCIGSGKSADDTDFFHEIVSALDGAGEFLVVGPGGTKLALARYLLQNAPIVAQKLVGVKTVDHPTDRQIVAYARKYFHAADRMLPQRP